MFGKKMWLPEPALKAKLERYTEILLAWQATHNLVSKGDAHPDKIWSRHIADSARLLPVIRPLVTPDTCIVDLGSGAGFPAVVLCMALNHPVTCVESTAKKAAFLNYVSRETNCPLTVIHKRIEQLKPLAADIITARALAPLPLLLEYAYPHLKPTGHCLFLKGERAPQEMETAKKIWTFALENDSSTSSGIIHIGAIKRGGQSKKKQN
jgi:16S rRNA (guanine527-N7)-methyltransferase